MIEETARIVALDGDWVWAETERKSACGACAAEKACGSAVLARVFGKRRARVRVANALDVRPGDQVVLGIREDTLVKGSIAVYLVPLLSMFVFGYLGQWAAERGGPFSPEAMSTIFGIVGLGMGFLWLRRYGARAGRDGHDRPVILRKLNDARFEVVAGQ